MAEHTERTGIAFLEDDEGPTGPERRHEVHDLAIHRDRDSGLQQAWSDGGNEVAPGRAPRDVAGSSVGQDEMEG